MCWGKLTKVKMLGTCVQLPICSQLGPQKVRSYKPVPQWMPGHNLATLY